MGLGQSFQEDPMKKESTMADYWESHEAMEEEPAVEERKYEEVEKERKE